MVSRISMVNLLTLGHNVVDQLPLQATNWKRSSKLNAGEKQDLEISNLQLMPFVALDVITFYSFHEVYLTFLPRAGELSPCCT